MPRILIADDDIELCQLLQQYLHIEGLDLQAVHSGSAVLQAIEGGAYDLLILDIMLPGMQGLDVLRQLRPRHAIPVLMLTARGEEMDRIIGLELGADDYLAKPCSPRELVARVRSILRRSQWTQRSVEAPVCLRFGGLELHPVTRQVLCGGEPLALTGAEFSLLQCLMQVPGQVVDKNALAQQVLGRRLQAFDRSLDMHISNVRKKIASHAQAGVAITAVRGVGYVLSLAEAG